MGVNGLRWAKRYWNRSGKTSGMGKEGLEWVKEGLGLVWTFHTHPRPSSSLPVPLHAPKALYIHPSPF